MQWVIGTEAVVRIGAEKATTLRGNDTFRRFSNESTSSNHKSSPCATGAGARMNGHAYNTAQDEENRMTMVQVAWGRRYDIVLFTSWPMLPS